MTTSKYLNPYKYYRGIQDCFLSFNKNHYHIKPANQPRVFMFGVPFHDNLGDQAITYAEIDFINKYLPNYAIVLIKEGFYKEATEQVKSVIKSNDIIAIHGGGNMGDVWANYEIEREYVVNAFNNCGNMIISFPQSYSFTDSSSGRTMKANANKIYSAGINFYLFARETLSLTKMENNFDTKNEINLVPDIVLRLDKRNGKILRQNLMTVLRKDREIVRDDKKSQLRDFAERKYTEMVSESDTTTDYIPNILSDKVRNRLLEEKWSEFSAAKVIITDRLHGMIFAYITGTPAIVFDNSNHKVRQSYNDWLSEVDYLHFAEDYSVDELADLVDTYMATDNFMGVKTVQVSDSSYQALIDVLQGKNKNG